MPDESRRLMTDDEFFAALAREGVDATRMGERYARAHYSHLGLYAPLDAYVAGYQDGARAALGLLAAHQDHPGGLDMMELFRRLCDSDAAAALHIPGRR